MITGFYRDTVTRHRTTKSNGIRGGLDWDNAETAVLDKVLLQQLTSEADGNLDGSAVTYRLYGPLDLDVRKGDRIEARIPELTWLEAVADPVRFRGLFAPVAHTETVLRGINGR